ncbi:hypothetical protein MATR_19130 [Marivirga tractuosa]|uniref:CbiN domain protein n=1 Tax=Marivirga tractuosa (strain ATCC 23168 / DSM 4126 / NBRC 15989 / NCIMB 1408 / VKM B-1430 / H-43) TaxID=643867 RepID=E4TP64_MARTH|nr:hypothetical protein [Marivirga tractuosa]ADR20467.1 hypothetical protein Ftrac_0461 [Marivirga tractuosa DSM 4126]BDD15088.1 hypothetical protein MATR_19130 [Marivirga tractuosa]
MRKVLKAGIIPIAMVITMLSFNCAHSCVCFIPELEEHFSQSDQVFSAKVLWIENDNHFYPTYNFGDNFVTLEIKSNYKNVPDEAIGNRISVIVSSACPYTFELDKEYIIFGEFVSSKNILFIDGCSVKAASSFHKWQELEELSQISTQNNTKLDTIDSPIESVSKKQNSFIVVLVFIAILSIGLNLYFILGKRKR